MTREFGGVTHKVHVKFNFRCTLCVTGCNQRFESHLTRKIQQECTNGLPVTHKPASKCTDRWDLCVTRADEPFSSPAEPSLTQTRLDSWLGHSGSTRTRLIIHHDDPGSKLDSDLGILARFGPKRASRVEFRVFELGRPCLVVA